MKQTYVILLSIVMTLSAVDMSAQRIPTMRGTTNSRLNNGGIRIECNAPIDVYVDGIKMCNAVNTCMVANLPRGEYFVEAYVVSSNQSYGSSPLVFSERVRISSMEVKDIVVRSDANMGNNYGNHGNYGVTLLPVMDNITYSQLLKQLDDASFSSDKREIISMAKTYSLFTVSQVKGIAEAMDFDSDKLWVLKTLYPSIVDRERSFSLQEVLDHSSSKKEFSKFATDYDRQHPVRP